MKDSDETLNKEEVNFNPFQKKETTNSSDENTNFSNSSIYTKLINENISNPFEPVKKEVSKDPEVKIFESPFNKALNNDKEVVEDLTNKNDETKKVSYEFKLPSRSEIKFKSKEKLGKNKSEPKISNKKFLNLKNIIIISVIALVLISSTIGFFIWKHFDSLTVVPQAASHIGNTSENPCYPFVDTDLNCEVKREVSDNLPRGTLISQSLESNIKVKKETLVTLIYSNGPSESEFPNLKGLSVDEAKNTLYELGFNVKDVEKVNNSNVEVDLVVSANIEVGVITKNGTSVILQISDGNITVPDWINKTREFVETDAKKLALDVIFKEEENDSAPGIVLKQNPVPGETSASNEIEVTISKVKKVEEIIIPDIIGMSKVDAQIELASTGFTQSTAIEVTNCEVNEEKVTSVAPVVGQNVRSDREIVLVVSKPDPKCTTE